MAAIPEEVGRVSEKRIRWTYRPSIAKTLPLGLAALILISLGTSLWFALAVAGKNTLELERSLAEVTLEAVVREAETQLGAAQTQVEFIGTLIGSGELDPADKARVADVMLGALAATPQVSGIAFVREDFRVMRVGFEGGETLVIHDDWSDRPGVQDAMAEIETLGQPRWREVIWVEDFKAPHVTMAAPVFRGGSFLGYLFPIVSISTLSRFLDRFDQTNGTHSFILYGRDKVLAHPALAAGFEGLSNERPLPDLNDIDDPVLTAIWREPIDDMHYLLRDSEIEGRVVEGDDEDYIYFYRSLDLFGRAPWILGIYFRESEVEGPMHRLFAAAAFGLIVLVVAVAGTFFFARSILPPIRRLTDASLAVQRLELSSIKPLGGSLFREMDTAAKAFDSMLAGLRRFETYVPRSLVLRLMRSESASIASEEREVTVFFTDIVDFSRISQRLEPAALADLLNRHFSLMSQAIEAEGGTIDKYIGDSVMAFWGAPDDQPDHAARACRTALEIARLLREDNRTRIDRGEEPLHLRIGLHSGTAIVGNIGAPGRVNYTLIGDTVNLAQRLEALGKEVASDGPDGEADVVILLSAETKARLDSGFRLEPLGDRQVRGRGAPLAVYRLLT